MKKKIAVLAGDGIGPEVMKVSLPIILKEAKKDGVIIETEFFDVGGIAYDNHQHPLPPETLRGCEQSDAIYFGSVGGPKWENLPPNLQPERGALLPLRKHFDLFANLRPAIVYPELSAHCPLKDRYIGSGIDLLIVRELTSGLYFGEPKQLTEEFGLDTMIYRKEEVSRIAKVAFSLAQKRRKKVTSVDKANVLSSMVFWRKIVAEVAKNYPDIQLDNLYVDNAAMQLILNPARFDVILAENTFGDILSDEASVLSGSLGLLPSASLNGSKFGLYEPSGGSAPDIAGQGIANPIAQILSGAMMLRFSFDMDQTADRIENAVKKAIARGYRTADIALPGEKKLSTSEMGKAIEEFAE